MKRTLASVIATVLMCLCFAGTTFAWLVAKTDPVKTTFTVGDINIMLAEHTSRNVKIVPGVTIEEDVHVTVFAKSEDCWLFIKVAKSENFDRFLSYEIDTDVWKTLLTDNENGYTVYYREVSYSESDDQEFDVLLNDVVTANSERTKDDYNALNSSNYPTLTYTAYAVQRVGFETAQLAWEEAKKLG